MKLLKQRLLFLHYFANVSDKEYVFKSEDRYLSYNYWYSLLPKYQGSSIRKAIGELTDNGEIEKIVRNRRAYFRLTILGKKRVKELFSNLFDQQRSKKGWILAILKPSKELRRHRNRLKESGFVCLRRGVYLQPGLKDLVDSFESYKDVFFIFIPKLDLLDEKSLVGELWSLDLYHKKTNDFIDRAKRLLKRLNSKKTLARKEISQISLISEKYFILIKNTMGLPKNLLPVDWLMPEAGKLFSRILQLYLSINKDHL